MKQEVQNIKYILGVHPMHKYCLVCMLIKNKHCKGCYNCINTYKRISKWMIELFK